MARRAFDRKLAGKIDLSFLSPGGTAQELKAAVREALIFSFASVAVNPTLVTCASRMLKGSLVRVTAAIGFPFGTHTQDIKCLEIMKALDNGADECDVVADIGLIRAHAWSKCRLEYRRMRRACRGHILKVIIETGFLTGPEIARVSVLLAEEKADFIKTSTGFCARGASAEDVRIIRRSAGGRVLIKASGGIRTYEQAIELISSGADRIGTSAGADIVRGNS